MLVVGLPLNEEGNLRIIEQIEDSDLAPSQIDTIRADAVAFDAEAA